MQELRCEYLHPAYLDRKMGEGTVGVKELKHPVDEEVALQPQCSLKFGFVYQTCEGNSSQLSCTGVVFRRLPWARTIVVTARADHLEELVQLLHLLWYKPCAKPLQAGDG